jgi:hypothetical protein
MYTWVLPSFTKMRYALFVCSSDILRACYDGKMKNRAVDLLNAQRHVAHSGRDKNHRRFGESVFLPVDLQLDHRAQIILIVRVAADKPDQLVVIMDMLLKDRISFGTALIPGRVHLKRARTTLVVKSKGCAWRIFR